METLDETQEAIKRVEERYMNDGISMHELVQSVIGLMPSREIKKWVEELTMRKVRYEQDKNRES